MKTTYIFDFDGTLVNSLPSITYFANNALNKFGLPSIPEERYKTLVGNGAKNLVKKMLLEVGAEEDLFEKVYTEYYTTYDENPSHLTVPYEGIVEMLTELKKRGFKTAVVSNKPHNTTKQICESLFGDLIDICRGQVEGCPIKPDPTAVFEVIKELGVNKEDCVYIGDTNTDMQTGKNAGLYTVGVLWGFRGYDELKSENPDMIISSPKELLKPANIGNSKLSKAKTLTSKTISKVKENIKLGKERSFFKSIILIAVLSLLPMLMQFIAQGCHIGQLHPFVFLVNYLPIFLLICLLYFILGSISIPYGITTVLLAVLLAINHFKIYFRDEPLKYTDLFLGTEANNMLKTYQLRFDFVIVFLIAFCFVSIVLVSTRVKSKHPKILPSVIGIILSVAIFLTLNFTVYKNTNIYKDLLTETFHETTTVSQKGLIYSLFNSANIKDHVAPENYSNTMANDALNKYEKEETETKKPNIIAVMCEAYTDIQKWSDIDFTDESPYSYYNYLKTKGCYGELFTPAFGGGTAATEFEFLTGNNTSAINQNMPIAYKTIIDSDVDSIVRTFKDMDYYAAAMHPGNAWFYNRQNVYPRMGFDSFTSKEDLTYEDMYHQSGYIYDSVSAQMIIDDYNRHLAENPDRGYFNFLVTIQNHGPYSSTELLYDKEYISKEAYGLTDQQYYIINNYLGGVADADKFMKTIYEYINGLDQPTVFIIFGDHLPALDGENKLFEKFGYDISSDTYEAYENQYSTDYVIAGNWAFNKKYRPGLKGQQGIISSNYLSIKLFQYANIPLTPYQSLSLDMMQYAPILSRQHNGTSAGFDEVLPEEFNALFEEYKAIQYYNLNDFKVKTEEQDINNTTINKEN